MYFKFSGSNSDVAQKKITQKRKGRRDRREHIMGLKGVQTCTKENVKIQLGLS